MVKFDYWCHFTVQLNKNKIFRTTNKVINYIVVRIHPREFHSDNFIYYYYYMIVGFVKIYEEPIVGESDSEWDFFFFS